MALWLKANIVSFKKQIKNQGSSHWTARFKRDRRRQCRGTAPTCFYWIRSKTVCGVFHYLQNVKIAEFFFENSQFLPILANISHFSDPSQQQDVQNLALSEIRLKKWITCVNSTPDEKIPCRLPWESLADIPVKLPEDDRLWIRPFSKNYVKIKAKKAVEGLSRNKTPTKQKVESINLGQKFGRQQYIAKKRN
jgi:hypothetical protein